MTSLPAECLRASIGYVYLMSFCPPSRAWEFRLASEPLRMGLALRAGSSPQEYSARALPEASRRIVAFHQRTREPDPESVATLAEAAVLAERGPAGVQLLDRVMASLAGLPGRHKTENRLRRSKGCQWCAAPCRHGYFALVTHPNFGLLKSLLEEEAARPAGEQDPLGVLWTFATSHLWRCLGAELGYISATHLGNLAYCLLTLGSSQSRYPIPEAEYRNFQQANQGLIERWAKNGRAKERALPARRRFAFGPGES